MGLFFYKGKIFLDNIFEVFLPGEILFVPQAKWTMKILCHHQRVGFREHAFPQTNR